MLRQQSGIRWYGKPSPIIRPNRPSVALRPMAWEPLIENDGAGILMAPLFLLNGDMEIDDAADEDELLAQASDMIPTCIAGIHEFWRNYRKPPSRRGRSRHRRPQAPVTRLSASIVSMVDQIGRNIARTDGADLNLIRSRARRNDLKV